MLAVDTRAVLLASGVMFLWALLLGVWKYRQMALAENHLAHPYVDTAHRAALLYSFALLLVATFVQLSGFRSCLITSVGCWGGGADVASDQGGLARRSWGRVRPVAWAGLSGWPVAFV
jgi:hypothetical protein